MQLERKISVGNLASMTVVIISAAIAWGIMSTRVNSTESQVEKLEKKVDASTGDIASMKESVGRMDERMKGVERSNERQERLLDEIIRKLNK